MSRVFETHPMQLKVDERPPWFMYPDRTVFSYRLISWSGSSSHNVDGKSLFSTDSSGMTIFNSEPGSWSVDSPEKFASSFYFAARFFNVLIYMH